MKTKQTFITTALAVTSILALQIPGSAAVKWDNPAAVPAGQRVEYAKAAIATDAAGNVFSAGYRDYGAGNVQALVTYRLNGGGGLGDAFFRPTADQYYYTGVAFNPATNSLYLTGTRVVLGVKTWFVRSLAVNPGVGIGAQNWIIYLNAAALGVAAPNTSSSALVFDGASIFVSGCLDNGIAAVKLVPGTGLLDGTWLASGANAGVRLMGGAGWICPALQMPGSVTGGIFQSIRQSFVRATNVNVFIGGTLDRGAGLREDMALLQVDKATGAVAVGYPFYKDNAGQHDCMFGMAAVTDVVYATGATVDGLGVSHAYTISVLPLGALRAGTPIIGGAGSYCNDIEAFDNAGTYTFSQGGNNGATGVVTRYTSTHLGALGAAANFAYGATPADEVCDLTIGYGATTGIVYATGQSWDFATLSNCEQVMRIDNAGFVSGDRLPAGFAENNGNGIIYTPAGAGSVLTSGNSLNAGVFTLQRSSVAP